MILIIVVVGFGIIITLFAIAEEVGEVKYVLKDLSEKIGGVETRTH